LQQGSEAADLKQILAFLRRRALLVGACAAVAAVAAYGFSKQQAKQYTATASLSFSQDALAQQIAGLPGVSGGTLAAQQSNELEQVKLGDMAVKTATALGHGLSPGVVAGAVSVKGNAESNVIRVAATARSPRLAASIANTYAKQFVDEQQSANRSYFHSALALVYKQLAQLTPKQRLGGAGIELQTRAQTLSLLSDLDYGTVQVAQEALPATSPSAPRVSRNTALGLLLGLLLGLGLSVLIERLDRRIRRSDELEAIYGLPLLGTVPKSAPLVRAARHGPAGAAVVQRASEAEAFGLIHAHLRFFSIDRELRTIVIASPGAGDGKSFIVRHLGEAAARTGARVLLIEADLREPSLAVQLGIDRCPGLIEVIVGSSDLEDAVQQVSLASATGGVAASARTLDVLTAGAVPVPNPAELLQSAPMCSLLERTRLTYDLVVVDTPPLDVVPDAFPMLTKVDGVAIVGWMGRSRRDAAERLHRVFVNSGAPLMGVIANGCDKPSVYGAPGYAVTPAALATPNGAVRSEELV
jgi:succinoglycan biosynthesis transport protein ExoP